MGKTKLRFLIENITVPQICLLLVRLQHYPTTNFKVIYDGVTRRLR